MKRTITLAVTFLISATTVIAQSQGKSIEQEFMRLQRAQDDAEAKRDIAVLDRLFNDDFVWIAGNGSISDKKKFLDDVKADVEPSSPQNLTYEDFKVRVYGKAAIVNYVLLVSGKDKDGKDFTSRYRMSVVWIKQKQEWRISNFQATRVR